MPLRDIRIGTLDIRDTPGGAGWADLVARSDGLGMLVKIADARRLAEASPGTTRLKTFDADENAPTRRINDALGFRPSVVSGGWRLDL